MVGPIRALEIKIIWKTPNSIQIKKSHTLQKEKGHKYIFFNGCCIPPLSGETLLINLTQLEIQEQGPSFRYEYYIYACSFLGTKSVHVQIFPWNPILFVFLALHYFQAAFKPSMAVNVSFCNRLKSMFST